MSAITGASLTGLIVIVTVAVLLVSCEAESSVILKVNESEAPSPPECT